MIILTVFMMSCNKSNYKLKGFAFYDDVKSPYLFQAVTPDGIRLQGRILENFPQKTKSDFWAQAIENYLPKKGYQLIKKSEIKADKQYFLFLVPGKKYDYFYLIHFTANDTDIHLVESGGRYAYLPSYEKDILDFATKIKW